MDRFRTGFLSLLSGKKITTTLVLFGSFWLAALSSAEESKHEEGELNINLRIKDSQVGKSPKDQGRLKISVKAKGLSEAQIKEIQGALNQMVETIADEKEEGLFLKPIQEKKPRIIGARNDDLPSKIQVEQIVVNVRVGGVLLKKDNETVMVSDEEIRRYISIEKAQLEKRGLKAILLVRAEKGVRFGSIQRLIKAGGAVGVKSIAYGFNGAQEGVGKVERVEEKPEQALPSISPSAKPSVLAPLLIMIEANGNIFLKDESGTIENLEEDPKVRRLPRLAARLKLLRSVAELASEEPMVQLKVNPKALQQRVIDVLNALAGEQITEVTFVQLLEPESR